MPKLTKHWLGVFKGEEMVGAVTLGWGTRPLHTIQKIINVWVDSSQYLEIGKMCLIDSEPRNSETQMISQLVRWLKENCREVIFLYTLADGIMGKIGTVYQAANFYYGGEYWTDVYISSDGEKIHPRTTRALCKENWRWHYEEASEGFSQKFKDAHDAKGATAKQQVYWLTPEYMNHIGLRKIKGKMFRYMLPLSKRARKILKEEADIEWENNSASFPKISNGVLEWKELVSRGKYKTLDKIPDWNLASVVYNQANVNQHR